MNYKPIKNFSNYLACDNGFIFSIKNKIFLKNGKTTAGYCTVTLCENKKRFSVLTHRIIATAFFGESELEVNHIDGNKFNNCINNLEFCSRKQNAEHAMKMGLYRINTTEIAEKKRKKIQQIDPLNGEVLNTFESGHSASKKLGINRGNICSCARNEIPTAGNFKWRYL